MAPSHASATRKSGGEALTGGMQAVLLSSEITLFGLPTWWSVGEGKTMCRDIESFYDTIDHDWLMKFVEHRVSDQRRPPNSQVFKSRSFGGRKVVQDGGWNPTGCGIFAYISEYLSALRVGSMGKLVERQTGSWRSVYRTICR